MRNDGHRARHDTDDCSGNAMKNASIANRIQTDSGVKNCLIGPALLFLIQF